MSFRPSRGPRAVVSLILLLVLVSPASAAEPLQSRPLSQRQPGTASASFVPGELIVRFAPGVTRSTRAVLLAEVGGRVLRNLRLRGAALVSLPPSASVRATAASLAGRPGVLYAQPNYLYRTAATPDDPRFGDLWGLRNGKDHDIDAPQAWNVTTGSSNVIVAVVDSGVDYLHPDLVGNIWSNPGETDDGVDNDGNGLIDDIRGWDFVGAGDDDPMDQNGHGTHVAGTIGARGDNGQGITGVSWDVSLMALRAAGADGSLEDADVADAFAYACDEGARVINASFGGPEDSQLLRDAINACPEALFVIAAGNSGTSNDVTPAYPCAFPHDNIVCVAATGRDDRLAFFSNFGDETVDLAAPGESILSATHHRVFFADGFESGLGRWDRGKASGKTWSATTEAAASGNASATDSEGADYSNRSNTWIDTTKTFDLSEGSECQLDFAIRWATESGDDWLLVEGTDDGWQTGAIIDGIPGGDFAFTGSSQGIFVEVPNLLENDGFDSPSDFEFGFRLVSNGSSRRDGAYVDDVVLHCLTGSHGSGDFVRMSGTSMAAPHVAGVAALMLAAYPAASPDGLRRALRQGADRISALSGDVGSGGRLDARGALDALDEVKPVASPPSHRLVANSELGASRIPVKVAWDAATDAAPSSGIAEYQVQVRTISGGAWGSWATADRTARLSTTEDLPPGRHQFRVRALDGGGNWSSWKTGDELVLKDPQGASAIDFGRTWATQSSSAFYHGSTRYTGQRLATASHAFTGSQVGWVASRGPSRGRAKVYIDGVLVATIDLYSATRKDRRIVFLQKWSTSAAHIIKIKVISPNQESSSSRVDLDAFLTLD